MKNIALIFSFFAGFGVNAQYYYKDLAGTRETNSLMGLYLASGVRSVSLKSYNADGSETANFLAGQVIDPGERTMKTISQSGEADSSILVSWFDEKNRLFKTIDTTGSSINTSVYEYDGQGKLMQITSISEDTLKSSRETEVHLWQYDAPGKPVKMIRIVNNIDTTVVQFISDGQGNTIEETPYKKDKAGEPVYYYYDNNHHLTDIVRYNNRLKKLLPDYMFEYSDAGQVMQKITVPANRTSDYLIWRYQYDSKGLKTKEACFTNDKQLAGKVEYRYQFGK
jgi:hypothetical protein